jgi:hypothetical protein
MAEFAIAETEMEGLVIDKDSLADYCLGQEH